jgi:hypothetical protein
MEVGAEASPVIGSLGDGVEGLQRSGAIKQGGFAGPTKVIRDRNGNEMGLVNNQWVPLK